MEFAEDGDWRQDSGLLLTTETVARDRRECASRPTGAGDCREWAAVAVVQCARGFSARPHGRDDRPGGARGQPRAGRGGRFPLATYLAGTVAGMPGGAAVDGGHPSSTAWWPPSMDSFAAQ